MIGVVSCSTLAVTSLFHLLFASFSLWWPSNCLLAPQGALIAIPSHTDFLLIHPPQQTPPHPTTLCQITPVLSNNCNCKTGSHSTHLVAETGHKWKQLGTTWPPPDWGRDLKKRFFIGISLNKGGAPKHAKICFFCLEKRLFGKKWQKVS